MRSLCPIYGVLRHVRGVVPGLKGPEAKGKVKRGRQMQGAGLQEAGLPVERGLGLSHGERHWFLGALGTNQV